jgi:putative signal transducing protein
MNGRVEPCNSTERRGREVFTGFGYNPGMTTHKEGERVVVAYTAQSQAEAMVIRGLLQSNGILSPDPVAADPFPMNEPPEGTRGTEVYVLESQAEEARRIIREYGTDDGASATNAGE